MRPWVEELLVAFQFLTRLPVSRISHQSDSLSRSTKFFPLIGLVVGLGASVLQHLLAPHLNRALVALLILIYLVLITGGLHEDGLADTVDAFGGGWNREQILTILRDSRINLRGPGSGAFAAGQIPASLHSSGEPIHGLCRFRTCPLSLDNPALELFSAAGTCE